jgi:hypothetical protein
MMAVKVSGYSSLDSLVNWAASYLVDIGYVSHEGRDHGFALISPDEDNLVQSVEDYDWFRGVVLSSLKDCGLLNVNVHQSAVDPDKEEGLQPVTY